MKCSNCGSTLDRRNVESAIAVMANGNEVIHSYFRCAACQAWTIEHYEDTFITGDTDIWTTGPIADAEGAQIVALVNACIDPQRKNCRCPSHRMLYTGRIDSNRPTVELVETPSGGLSCELSRLGDDDLQWLGRFIAGPFDLTCDEAILGPASTLLPLRGSCGAIDVSWDETSGVYLTSADASLVRRVAAYLRASFRENAA